MVAGAGLGLVSGPPDCTLSLAPWPPAHVRDAVPRRLSKLFRAHEIRHMAVANSFHLIAFVVVGCRLVIENLAFWVELLGQKYGV